jgi:hypothetical protein
MTHSSVSVTVKVFVWVTRGQPSAAIRWGYPKSHPSPNPDLMIRRRAPAHHKRGHPNPPTRINTRSPSRLLLASIVVTP